MTVLADVDRDGIHADHHEEEGPGLELPDVDHQVKQRQQEQAAAAGHSTNELVHKFLLMGKLLSHSQRGRHELTPPATARPAAFTRPLKSVRLSQWPAITPKSTVAIEGMVENSPSGSRTVL